MKKKILVSLLVLVAVAVLAAGIYITWLRTPPRMPTTMDEAVAVMNSKQYARLSDQEKQPYIDRARQLAESLTPEQRKALWDKAKDDPNFRKNAREMQSDMMLQRAKDFATTDPAKRKQILDMFIGMQEMMARSGAGPARVGGPSRPGGKDPNRAEGQKWMEDQVEHGNPQKQAYFSEFFKALAERRQEMGLSPYPKPPQK